MPFRSARGIEVGHIFKLGTKYSEVLGAVFPDENGVQKPIVMGCYGIGVGRLLAAAVEQNHDENGMVLPASIAPFEVLLTALNVRNAGVADAAGALYDEMRAAGLDVLYDDRDESAGSEVQRRRSARPAGSGVVVSPRNLRNGEVEVKPRSGGEARMGPTRRGHRHRQGDTRRLGYPPYGYSSAGSKSRCVTNSPP